MSTNANFTCLPNGAVPLVESLPIPKGINYAIVKGRNGSEPWMVKCCAPNPVSLIGGCYIWCELSAAQIHTNKDGKKYSDFGNCIKVNGRDDLQRDPGPIVYEVKNVAAASVNIKGMGVWMLVVTGLLVVL